MLTKAQRQRLEAGIQAQLHVFYGWGVVPWELRAFTAALDDDRLDPETAAALHRVLAEPDDGTDIPF